MAEENVQVVTVDNGVPIKMWTRGVGVENGAMEQLRQTAQLPFIYKWVAVMPDVHLGIGATVGSVIPTKKAIIPAAVGVDIGCGMCAVRTGLTAGDLPDSLAVLRAAIERKVPRGFFPGGKRSRDEGSWENPPPVVRENWEQLEPGYRRIVTAHPELKKANNMNQLGTLGSGNHFVEVCLDQENRVWFMLHSGSRGIGNAIGTTFIALAKKEMARLGVSLPHHDLAYLTEGTALFDDYLFAVTWAQEFALINRQIMLQHVFEAVGQALGKTVGQVGSVVDCHHNYVARESHFGEGVWVTRKGAVRARAGEMGIIPGSMGARSHIVRGLGNPESFQSCSHGAGRTMSRTEAKRRISLEEHLKALDGVECRRDAGVIDESPAAYKSIDAVMAAQKDLVEVVHTLRQVVCVKG